MFFRQVLHEDLGCASYVVGDGGEAAVIDPKWEIEDYLRLAEEHGFAVTHILETHNHADHVSGKGRLAKATGATIHVPADATSRSRTSRWGTATGLSSGTFDHGLRHARPSA
jgi:hydroxyacylglutathione hydrolase